ncbi:MAG TPA: hypothetical protein VFB42_10510 [Gaiellaceae bacterium]|nr:hypothetical protein [Gaiellaceae bacterium]
MNARLVAPALAAVACAVPVSASAHGVAKGPCSTGNVASTASYRMALELGPQEEMYLPSEVKARHIKTGEIMLGGEMSMVDKAPGTRVFHLEVHVCTKSGAVVTRLEPRIVVNAAAMTSMKVPSAIMVGVGEPISDYHYGNDVALEPGARITVRVTVKGQTATFRARVPR